MAEHTIETRILLRYDTLANWMKSTVILQPGEAAVAAAIFNNTIESTNHVPANTPPAIGIKIGDGYHYFYQLPWVQAVAGDVYNWAKQQNKPSYEASEISGLTALIQRYINESGGGGGTTPIEAETRLYRLIKGTGNDSNKYYLQSKLESDTDWVTDELNYVDLSELAAILNWLGDARDYWTLTGFTLEKINEQLALLNYTDTANTTQVITAVNQTNGQISVVRGPLNIGAIDGILDVQHGGTGLSTLSANAVLVGNGTDAVSLRAIENSIANNNNLATNSAIIQYVNSVYTDEERNKLANIEAYAQVNNINKIIINDTNVFEPNSNKEIHIQLNQNILGLDVLDGAQYTENNIYVNLPVNNKKLIVSKIAATGNIDDLVQFQDSYITLYCGDSEHVI